MPPTKEMIEKAMSCLGDTQLVKFSADRNSIRAGESVNLSWDVATPAGCALSVRLNNSPVSKKGSRAIVPVRSVAYRLDCAAAGLSKLLGVVEIAVDSSRCSPIEVPEDLIRPEVLASVDASLAEYNVNPDNADRPVTKRRETVVEIEPDGIVIRLRLKLGINNFFDPDVDVDAKIGVGVASEGPVLAFYRSFEVDVDWPWWVTGITLGITKIVEEFMDKAVSSKMKDKIVNDLRASFQSKVDGLSGTVVAIDTIKDAVLVTLCRGEGGSVLGQIVGPFGHDLTFTRG